MSTKKETIITEQSTKQNLNVEVNTNVGVGVENVIDIDLTPIERVINALSEQNQQNQIISNDKMDKIIDSVISGNILEAQTDLLREQKRIEFEAGISKTETEQKEKIKNMIFALAVGGLIIYADK